MNETSATAFPLTWPDGWPQTKYRKTARYSVEFGKARGELEHELKLMRATNVVLSSNVPIRLDGKAYAGAANKRYQDPGVAVYFQWKKEPWVIACDTWNSVRGNVRAIGLTVAALRAIERSGATELLKRAFSGFKALPAKKKWWEIIGCSEYATIEEVTKTFRLKALAAHPDKGGNENVMAELNGAMAEAKTEAAT